MAPGEPLDLSTHRRSTWVFRNVLQTLQPYIALFQTRGYPDGSRPLLQTVGSPDIFRIGTAFQSGSSGIGGMDISVYHHREGTHPTRTISRDLEVLCRNLLDECGGKTFK